MAEIFLSAFIQTVIDKLASPELIKFARREGVHTAIKKWTTMAMTIREVVDDAEEKQLTNRTVKRWLDELRDLAYDVEDMLDEFATEALLLKLIAEPETSTNKVRRLIPTCCTSFSPSAIAFKSRIRSEIAEINGRLEDICKQRTRLGLERVAGETSTTVWQKPTSTSLVNESCVYGRDEDKEKIIKLLVKDESNSDKFCVIPIVGMGGIGKTTLAQLVYNNGRVEQHFDFKAWVCVSDDFDFMRITKTVLASVSPTTSVPEDLNQVQIELKEALTGKKFLVVLDDVWNKKFTDWDALWTPFRAGAQESRVIVTTRDGEVASLIGTDPYHCHYVNHLSDVDCWSVFVHFAFENRNIGEHQNLVLIGKKIVEKCKGLPLAAKTLGGLLRSKLKEDEWEDILNSKIWDLPEEKSDILPALRLSYHRLPPHLKRCFAYCSIFPKCYEFSEKGIVLLWMAEGFLQQQGEKQMEDVGHEYFCDLVSRSFFQSSSRNKSLFVMHDLINDLAEWAAEGICFRLEDKSEGNKQGKIPKKVRHSSYIGGQYDGVKKFEAFYEVKCTLRTFLPLMLLHYGDCYITNNVPLHLLPKLRCLRVLSLSGYRITELPDSIGNLKHLRYLDLSSTEIRNLPESTTTLYNLQTLKLTKCYSLKKLPTKMRNLINLRHLDITNVNSIKEMPPGMGMLTSLQTLSNFVVGRGSESGIRELGKLLHIRGVLSISRLENVIDAWEAQEANLNDKLGLDMLKMEWSNDIDDNPRATRVEIDVLDMLQPHKKLKELTIKCYSGTIFPLWIGHPSFSNTVLLRLEDCIKCTALPPLGQLPSLKELCIKGMKKVNSVDPEFYGEGCPKPFPSLDTLSFDDMLEWKYWFPCGVDKQVEVFPCLRKLSIKRCPKLLGKLPSHLASLEKLIIHGCRQLVISISIFPKLCELDIQECQEVVQTNTVDLSSLKSMVVSNISNLMCLTEGFVQGLTKIEYLKIVGCNGLTSLWQKEVEFLQHLTSLHCLRIEGCPNFFPVVAEEAEQQLEVPCRLEKLQGLHRLTSLRELTINGCSRLVSFPEMSLPYMLKELWIGRFHALKSLPQSIMPCSNYASLEFLRIYECDSITSIARGQIPSTLKKLEIQYCQNLQSLLDEEEGSTTTTTSLMMQKSNKNSASLLEDLCISGCSSLTSLSSRGELPTTLKCLRIYTCPKLELVAERFPNDTSLEIIWICDCESLKSLPEGLHNLSRLCYILIYKCPSLVSFPDGGLPATNLRHLKIDNCEKLEALPDCMHNLTSLQDLGIERCPGIVSFPEEGFPTNLTSLWICKPLFERGLHRLTSLRRLDIEGGYPDLVSFTEEKMMLPTSLTSLHIGKFPSLEYLSSKGFQNLTSLEELRISDCPKLKSFPEEGLPHSLLLLHIFECPLLKQRCKKDQGRYWPIIAHIPYVEIDGRFIFDPED